MVLRSKKNLILFFFTGNKKTSDTHKEIVGVYSQYVFAVCVQWEGARTYMEGKRRPFKFVNFAINQGHTHSSKLKKIQNR